MSKLLNKPSALRWFSCLLLLMLFASRAWAGSTTVVISQIYTAGGNGGATYNADYVELFNVSNTSQNLNGFALQYASAAGTTGSVIALPAGITLAPGQRYLIQGSAGANGVALPNAADVTLSALAMGASAGKIYLTSNQTALANVCTDPSIVDFVGYGTTASCFEGTAAPVPTATLADVRNDPCTDTNDNGKDFSAVAVSTANPRNSSAARTPCGGGGSTSIAISATANPTSVYQGATTLLAATVTPAKGPASTGVAVTANLTAFSGSATQPLYDDGTHGDLVANDNTYSYTLTAPNNAPLGSNTIVATVADAQVRTASANIMLTVLAPVTLVPIHTIQGKIPGTAAYNGQTIMTSGIVTGVKVNGFFLQAKDADADTDAATPEGIFVHTGTGLVPSTAVLGTNMQVTGTVALFPSDGPLPSTELDNPTAFTVLNTGNALPTAITLTTTNPSPTGGFSQLQRYQSMRVAVPSFTVTGPTDGTQPSEATELYVSTGQFWGTVTGLPRPVREPGLEVLDSYTAAQPSTIPRFDDNPELFQADSLAMAPTPGPLDLATGTLLTNLSGVFDFSGGKAVLDIDAATRPTVTGGLTVTPVPAAAAGEVTIGDQNLERFYNTVKGDTFGHNGDVALTATAYALRLSKASLAIRNVMRTPDILAVEEMESLANLTDLSNKISADAMAAGQADPHYAAYLIDGNDVGVINVGYLVNPSKITVIKVEQFGKSTLKPGTSTLLNDRPPLVLHAGVKRAGGPDYPLTIIVNHLRSLNNVTDPTSTGDNIRTKRQQQAEYLATLAQGYQAAGEHVVVVGDLNTFEFSDGLVDSFGILKGSTVPANQVVVAGTNNLVTPNLVDMAPTNVAKGDYSYSFAGNAQTLDHFLVTQDIASITHTSAAHFNADFPAVFRNDPNRPEVGSDHDGVVGYIKVPGTTQISLTPATLTFASQVLSTTSAAQAVTVQNSGTAAIAITSIVASAGFAQTNNCGASLAGGASCTVNVSFKPTAAGPVTGTVVLTDSDITATQSITLAGTGAGTFSTTTLTAAPAAVVGAANVTLTATVTGNAGTSPTGTVNFLDGTTVLKSGATLTGGVATFSTTTLGVGPHSITAVYSGDALYPASTSTASTVTVTAPPVPDFTFSISNTQVVPTQYATTAVTTVNVAMVNGFNTTVTFACSGLPAASRCTFSPASLSASGSSTLSVTINTVSAALVSPFEKMRGMEGVMACTLLALPFFVRRKTRSGIRRAATLMALLVMAGGLAAISGCGGSNATTPTGTSTVTVTATGGSVTHTATFNLVVQ